MHQQDLPAAAAAGPAAPGEDRVSSPDEESLHTFTTPITRGQKQTSPGSIPPCKVWKPQTHWVIADSLGLMEPALGESRLSGQRRGPAPPGEDKFSSSDQKSFHISTTPTTRVENVDTAPKGVETPTPQAGC